MLTTVHTLPPDLLHQTYGGSGKLSWIKAELRVLNSKRDYFMKIVVNTMAEHCSTVHFTLKFHHLPHIAEDLRRFGTLPVLIGSPFEHYNVHI